VTEHECVVAAFAFALPIALATCVAAVREYARSEASAPGQKQRWRRHALLKLKS
jgi:hypothetical protein